MYECTLNANYFFERLGPLLEWTPPTIARDSQRGDDQVDSVRLKPLTYNVVGLILVGHVN